MKKAMRSALSAALCLSLFTFLAPVIPSANAAACAVTYGTVSGTTRWAKFTSGSSCTWTVPAGVTSLQYLVVGGGGGGGGAGSTTVTSNLGAGGGGAGGMVSASTLSVTALGTVTLTVGSGGAGGSAGNAGGSGGASSMSYSSTSISSTGGNGGGGSPGTGDVNTLSGDGGGNASYTGGASVWDGGGGGAGAGGNGTAGTDIGGQGGNGGAGGAGVSSSILGTTYYYGGGGGGGGTPSSNSSETDGTGAVGGSGVGGNGGGTVGGVAGTLAAAGSANTGSGGGGGGWRYSYTDANRAGAAGADGVIILVYTKTAGSVSSLSITTNSGADNTYKTGEVVSVTVVMSEAVTITGTPRIPVLGLTAKYFNYSSGTGTSSIIFSYTVLANDSATAGVGVTANTLELNAGTILDTSGLAITLSHVAIPQATNQKIDGISPTISATSSVSVAENQSSSQTLIPSEPGVFRIAGTNDQAYFTFDTQTGVLTLTPRDFENPQDANADNVYYIAIAITDLAGNPSGTYNFFYTVTNVAESAVVGTPSLSGAAKKGVNVTVTVTSDVAGKADFYWNGKRIARCFGVPTTGSSPNFTATCTWKPTSTARATIYAVIRPTSGSFTNGTSSKVIVTPALRGTLR